MDRSRASYRRRHRCSHSVKSSLRHTVPDPDAARRGLLVAYEEITGGSDDLAEWLRDHGNNKALLLDEDVDAIHVQAVMDRYALDLNEAEIIEVGRDPFLIAYALVAPEDRVVVTVEASKPSCKRANRRIPDVCNDLGVQWCNSFQMMTALDFTTGWRTRSSS
ncbi:DUF4411 family protein [Sinorhizobium meliloti]|nr:DUF4411 family protein [Sinorhizobium meliloti]